LQVSNYVNGGIGFGRNDIAGGKQELAGSASKAREAASLFQLFFLDKQSRSMKFSQCVSIAELRFDIVPTGV
jgi:hypothetical protein